MTSKILVLTDNDYSKYSKFDKLFYRKKFEDSFFIGRPEFISGLKDRLGLFKKLGSKRVPVPEQKILRQVCKIISNSKEKYIFLDRPERYLSLKEQDKFLHTLYHR